MPPRPRIWICSYGGSGSNWLNNALRPHVVDRDWWRLGPCHAGAPIPDAPCTAAVYIYRHPCVAYHSQKRRGLHRVNQRKMGYPGPNFTTGRMARAMIEQMVNWAHPIVPFPVVNVRFETLHTHLPALEDALGLKLKIPFQTPPRHIEPVEDFGAAVHVWRTMPDFHIHPATPREQIGEVIRARSDQLCIYDLHRERAEK